MGNRTRGARSGYNVRAKLFPSDIVNEIEVIRKLDFTQPKIFYAKNYDKYRHSRGEFGGGSMQKELIKSVIITKDLKKGDIKLHDTVEYMGEKYNVDDFEYIDDNRQKRISRRPEVKTIITLGASVNE